MFLQDFEQHVKSEPDTLLAPVDAVLASIPLVWYSHLVQQVAVW